MMPEPSVEVMSEQERFLRAVFGDERGYLFVSTNDRAHPGPQAWKDHSFVYPLQIADILNYAEVSDSNGLDVYVAAQLYSKPDARQKTKVKVCPSAWADLDAANPNAVDPRPSVALETSPGHFHGFWRAVRSMEPSEAEELSRRIAYAHHAQGADLGGWDLTQVLRVPGTRNHKYGDKPVVRMLWCEEAPISDEAFARLPSAPARAKPSSDADSDSDPPIPLSGVELEHWSMTSAADRSSWAMRMVAILKEHKLSDRVVKASLANHPIYLSKMREKWGNRETLVYDDIERCIQHWREHPAIDLSESLASLNGTAVGTGSGTASKQADEPVELLYPLQSLGDLLLTSDADAGQLIEGIIWAQRTTWAFSAPNVGKTIFLLACGMHIAAGVPFCGRRVEQGPVLFIEEDSPLSVLADYVEFLADLYGFDLDTLPFRVNKIQGLRLIADVGLKAAIASFEAMAEEFGRPPVATFIDAAERIVPSDKFSTRELDYLTKFLQYAVGRGSTTVVVDHTKRPQMFKGKTVQPDDPMELLYGARAKSAISDAMLYFSGGLKLGGMKLSFVKFRGETPDPVDVSFRGDEGFSIGRPKPMTRTPTEQKIIAWFNNVGGIEWYWLQDIIKGADVPERSGKRAIVAMAKRQMLRRSNAESGQPVQYRLAQSYDGVFE